MDMSAGLAVNAYRQVARQGVPEDKLLVLGLDGILEYMRRAKAAIDGGALADKVFAMNRAQQLVEHLLAALPDEGDAQRGALTQRLAGIYRYLLERMYHANIFDDTAALDDCAAVVGALRDSWIEGLQQT
jgi:flagellar protein FliS